MGKIKRIHVDGRKQCNSCEEWKLLEDYGRRSRHWDGLMNTCKSCRSKQWSEKYEPHPRWSRQREDGLVRCTDCKVYKDVSCFGKSKTAPHFCAGRCHDCRLLDNRQRTYLKKFGLSMDDYKALLESQGGGCAICGKTEEARALAVDHCHKTGRVRGILCRACNTGIGHLQDDPILLGKAIEYLG